VASKAIDFPRKIADHGPDYFEELRIQKRRSFRFGADALSQGSSGAREGDFGSTGGRAWRGARGLRSTSAAG
jgi:hypothetical protein